MIAAVFRSYGVDARPAPDSDAQTLELGSQFASGEECLPHRITLGDFVKVCRAPGFDPARTAFLMPTSSGPCRFGQYAPYLRQVLEEMGYPETLVLSPDCKDGYAEFGIPHNDFMRNAWMGVLANDVVFRFLLKTRPYETHAGDADAVFEESVRDFEAILSRPGVRPARRLAAMVDAVRRMRDRFRRVPARYTRDRPLIGLVGEIFCRLNTFSNNELIRSIEQHGGECWISDVSEWIWYVHRMQRYTAGRQKGRLSVEMLKVMIKGHIQRRYEHAIMAPLAEDLRGYEEPHDIREVLELSRPYLPWEGSLGEMVLSVGKAIYLYGKGADGIIDISPFTCMNGIICEAVYPSVSTAHEDLPIRMFYFDGIAANTDRDVEIFLDLARAYQRRKRRPRVYPGFFESAVCNTSGV